MKTVSVDAPTRNSSRSTASSDARRSEHLSLHSIIALAKACPGFGLSGIPQEQLSKCLRPILESLQELNAETLLGLEQSETGALLRPGVHIRPIHTVISPPCTDPNSVRYLHLNEIPGQYSMGIFVFPPFARIPLHDHPGMCVLSRVLYGELQRLGLDLAREQPQELAKANEVVVRPSASWLFSRKIDERLPPGSKLAYQSHAIDHLSAPSCTVLYPFEGNLHEFVAGPDGAAVLDVLLPPYNSSDGRDCTFYEIRDCTDNMLPPSRIKKSAAPCWIVPTGKPEDFHCVSGSYRGLGIV